MAFDEQRLCNPYVGDRTDVILLKDADGYHFRINMQETDSFKNLDSHQQQQLNSLYHKYFFRDQDELWKSEAEKKLDVIQESSEMLICAEDLGMVPAMVENVLKEREILSLEVQRMPKTDSRHFTDPGNAPYLSVVTPSTHDMSTIREWWEADKQSIQYFYNYYLGHYGTAPFYCEPWICREIIRQHLRSPAMWAVFLMQDLLAMNDMMRREKPGDERINNPADPDHCWNYRMHVPLEQLLQNEEFIEDIKALITEAGR
jgi:4-alpha-glucanotransferase